MYAVIKTGGKQHKVSEGDILLVEKLAGSPGEVIELAEVLMVSGEEKLFVGSAELKKVKVFGTIIEHTKGDKVIVFKYKPKKGHHKKTGHRQSLTRVEIDEISLTGVRTVAVKKPKVEVKEKVKAEAKPKLKPRPKAEVKTKEKVEVKAGIQAKPKAKPIKTEVKTKVKAKTEVKVKPKTETKKLEKAPVVKKATTKKTEPKKPAAKKTTPKG
jgi:large subunit ribosomal protein L21